MSNQSGVKTLWIGLMIIAGVLLLPEFFIFLIYVSLTIWMLAYFTLLLPTCWRASISDSDAWKCWFAFTVSLYFLLGCCWLFELSILGFSVHGWFYYFIMLMTVPWLSSYFLFHTGAYIDIASSGRYLRCRDWIYYDGRSIPAIAYNFRSLDVEGENNLSGYGTDGVDIFFKGETVLGAEPRSFRC
ncbi:hypothetical protein [Motilimonas sp. E26]|uniref:hypothetical protein n=1 Tax=Motilimonas sp. E26 TaxID=2865674 RepID=UPI001E64CC62|nr:hypothetical protein [Motilimonas sp. E26]MCE0556077.1 hypothetical protein [Motilimonas sp. E26]